MPRFIVIGLNIVSNSLSLLTLDGLVGVALSLLIIIFDFVCRSVPTRSLMCRVFIIGFTIAIKSLPLLNLSVLFGVALTLLISFLKLV
jgi:hypothetical protein